jgi:hypothetical protein
MGKHETSYARVERDHYPTREPWVIEALAEHVDLRGLFVQEPACGRGDMVKALQRAGCAQVFPSDIVDQSGVEQQVLDFLGDRLLKELLPYDAIITNPPFGPGGRLAVAFIARGLMLLRPGGLLALLLPCDFDSAKTRAQYFGDCPHFIGKIVLRRRVVWFERADGVREAPKENTAWFLWRRNVLRFRQPPILLYAPTEEISQ